MVVISIVVRKVATLGFRERDGLLLMRDVNGATLMRGTAKRNDQKIWPCKIRQDITMYLHAMQNMNS